MGDKAKSIIMILLVSALLSVTLALMVWTHILKCETERKIEQTYQILGEMYKENGNESRTVSSTNFYKDGVLIWHCPGEGNISGQEGSYIKELIYPDGTTRLVVDDNWQFGTTGKENSE